MNPLRPDNEEQEDAELLREVHKALKSRGWLLPETVGEVREAERALEEEPVEVPEELLDPFRLLDILPKETPDPAPPPSPNLEFPLMPSGLAQLVQEVGLSPAQTVTLIGFQSQMLFNRSESKKDEVSYEDWKKFYLGVKDFL
jgi:hypothetical protein